MAMTQDAYLKMIGNPSSLKINPDDPEQLKKMRQMIESQSGGKRTIKTAKELEGKGVREALGDFGGYGYTVVESEAEKNRLYNPNSEEYRKERQREKQASREQQDRLRMRMKGFA